MENREKKVSDHLTNLNTNRNEILKSLNTHFTSSVLIETYLLVSDYFQHSSVHFKDSFECSITDLDMNCVEYIDNTLSELVIKAIKSDYDGFLKELQKFIEIDSFITDAKSNAELCGRDRKAISQFVNFQLQTLQNSTMFQTSEFNSEEDGSLDLDKIYSTIIDPLTNKNRLAILFSTNKSNQRFKDLEDNLDLQAGHLLYHLNPLKEAGYVKQDDKKAYYITGKGKMVLDYLRQLYDIYEK